MVTGKKVRAYPDKLTKLLWPALLLWIGVSLSGLLAKPARAQDQNVSEYISQTTKTRALQLAEKIAAEHLVLDNAKIPALSSLKLPHGPQRLKTLRILSSDAAMFRLDGDKKHLYQAYLDEAKQQNSVRDEKLAHLFILQNGLMNQDISVEPYKSRLQELRQFRTDADWYIAQRAALLEATLQIFGRQFDIGLRDAGVALKKIPKQIGPDIDEALYETYDFIAYLQLIQNNLDGGVKTTAQVIKYGKLGKRQIDGISLINNLAYAFDYWREYETSEKLAEILFRLNTQANTKSDLAYYRYAQAQNNAGNYKGALKTARAGLAFSKTPARKLGLMIQEAIALAGLGDVKEAERQLAKVKFTAKAEHIKMDGFTRDLLTANILLAAANKDVRTLQRLQKRQMKLAVQRLLTFQNNGIVQLHAALEDDKAWQEEQQRNMRAERDLARSRAKYATIAAILLVILAMALGFGFLQARRNLALSESNLELTKDNLKKEKEVVAALEEAARGRAEGERVKKQFLAVMSHEFRTPLNGILGIADLLCQTGETQALRDQSRIILESGENLLNLLTGILDMVYLDAGSMPFNPGVTDIRKICDEVYHFWLSRVDSKKVILTCGVADDVPEHIMLDRERVKQAMNNLVSNGVKFTPEGRVHIHVTMRDAPPEPGQPEKTKILSVIVADTGIGMTEEVQQKLFKPFVQADSSMTREYGGAGIGLSVTRGLARFMGGDVSFTSSAGAGSEFEMTLKTIAVADAERDPETGAPVFNFTRSDDLGMNFDKNEQVREMLEQAKKKQEKDRREREQSNGQDVVNSTAAPLVLELAERRHAAGDEMADLRFREEALRKVDKSDLSKLVGLQALVVEDVLANQEVIRALLEPAGCLVSTADNGLDALEQMKHKVFDLVFMDIRMPIMDGVEATAEIRKLPGPNADVPIIAVTADASEENNTRCLAAGADVFLTKPVVVSELFAAIRFARERRLRSQQQADEQAETAKETRDAS